MARKRNAIIPGGGRMAPGWWWKKKREAAAAGGGDPVLLADLVAGWALTAGPEQTLDSSGVIESGALDLTNHNGATFGETHGATMDGITQYLDLAASAALKVDDDDFFLCARFYGDANASEGQYLVSCVKAADWDIDFSTYNGNTGTDPAPHTKFILGTNENSVYPEALSDEVEDAVPHFAFFWRTGGFIYVQVDDGTPSQAVAAGGQVSVADRLVIARFTDWDGGWVYTAVSVKWLRFWKGNIAAPVAALFWLYNSGIGRTDAELAAYTG